MTLFGEVDRRGASSRSVVLGDRRWSVATRLTARPLGLDASTARERVEAAFGAVEVHEAPWGRFLRLERDGAVNWYLLK